MTAIKICGLQSVEVLKSIYHLPIEYVGFVFAPSKRRIAPAEAANLASFLQEAKLAGAVVPKTVGVFRNPTDTEVAEALAAVPLDVVQLHGDEPPEQCLAVREKYGTKIVKAFSIRKSEEASSFLLEGAERLAAYRGTIDIALIDTLDPTYGGGSGQTFRWELIPAYMEQARRSGMELFVAGGLQPDNVTALTAAYRPDGVDVSSGVETNGTKDIDKINAFVERVRAHEHIA